jgi:hypothetical protein
MKTSACVRTRNFNVKDALVGNIRQPDLAPEWSNWEVAQ